MEFNTGTPPISALYLVDRGPQGRYYRYYNAETDKWGMCGADMNEALKFRDNHSTFEFVGFFPWVGPLTGPKFDINEPVLEVTEDTPKQPKQKKVARKMARSRTGTPAKLVVSTVGNTRVGSIVKGTKIVHPDGTVFFRADRNKWVAVYGGKQEAARPTAEACLNFLKKKYNVVGNVLNKE
mgnify:CR=1 FL=1